MSVVLDQMDVTHYLQSRYLFWWYRVKLVTSPCRSPNFGFIVTLAQKRKPHKTSLNRKKSEINLQELCFVYTDMQHRSAQYLHFLHKQKESEHTLRKYQQGESGWCDSRLVALQPALASRTWTTVAFLCPLCVQLLITKPVCWIWEGKQRYKSDCHEENGTTKPGTNICIYIYIYIMYIQWYDNIPFAGARCIVFYTYYNPRVPYTVHHESCIVRCNSGPEDMRQQHSSIRQSDIRLENMPQTCTYLTVITHVAIQLVDIMRALQNK